MFGIGIGEFVLVMIVALLVVGPDKLPGIARTVAKTFNELKRAGNELRKTVTDLDLPDPEKVAREIKSATASVAEGFSAITSPRVTSMSADKDDEDSDREDEADGAKGAGGTEGVEGTVKSGGGETAGVQKGEKGEEGEKGPEGTASAGAGEDEKGRGTGGAG